MDIHCIPAKEIDASVFEKLVRRTHIISFCGRIGDREYLLETFDMIEFIKRKGTEMLTIPDVSPLFEAS